jgi:putative RecB family exonuclease
MTFQNSHLSYSRMSRFEQCALSFKLQYIDKIPSEPGMPLRFGKVIHAALEALYREVIEQEHTGPLDEDRAIDLLSQAWADDGLVGVAEFAEGVAMLRDYVRAQGVVDHRNILAVEHEFRIAAGRFTVLGFIDRIDRVDDETVEIVDYKSNRQLFTRDEVDTSLQMSLYEIAVRQKWPWVKTVKLRFDMLRHGVRLSTTRTQAELDSALKYMETVGRMTEEATDYPAKVGAQCVHCDHRTHCPSYSEALTGKTTPLGADPEDLEAVAREREQVANLAKIMYARKSELEGILKAHLQEHDELTLAGVRYSLAATTSSITYPAKKVLRVLSEFTGRPHDDLFDRVTTINKDALDGIVREFAKGAEKSKATMLRAELEALAERAVSPRFTAKAVRA